MGILEVLRFLVLYCVCGDCGCGYWCGMCEEYIVVVVDNDEMR